MKKINPNLNVLHLSHESNTKIFFKHFFKHLEKNFQCEIMYHVVENNHDSYLFDLNIDIVLIEEQCLGPLSDIKNAIENFLDKRWKKGHLIFIGDKNNIPSFVIVNLNKEDQTITTLSHPLCYNEIKPVFEKILINI